MKITISQLRCIIKEEVSRARRHRGPRSGSRLHEAAPETIRGNVVSMVREDDGWTIYTWDGEPISDGLTYQQALREFEKIEARNRPVEFDDSYEYEYE
jgi:hypothetical protein